MKITIFFNLFSFLSALKCNKTKNTTRDSKGTYGQKGFLLWEPTRTNRFVYEK